MISARSLLTAMSLFAALAAAQGNRPAQGNVQANPAAPGAPGTNTIPVLQYQPPPDFMRSGAYSPDDYVSNSFNGSFQIYQFEPFNGNVAEAFQRTLFRDRIDIRHKEENVAGPPQFQRGQMPGADAVFIANFTENTVGIPHPHMRMVIVASGSVAIVDAATINPTLWARLAPVVNNVIRTMRVDRTAGPPSLTEGPGPAGQAIAGLYRGIKQKFMTGLTFQASYYTPATHYYLFSPTGFVYRAYDQLRAPGGDITRFDFGAAQRTDPVNSGRFTIADDKLYIKMGKDPGIFTALPKDNTVTIESVTYTRQ